VSEPAIELLETTWASIAALGDGLDDARWERATDCPGWSVKDNLSHLIGIEKMLLGEPADPTVEPRPDHVRNDVGAFNEAAIAARRPRPGADVLSEFKAVTARRLEALRSLPPGKWDEIGPTPTGEGTYRHFMTMRAFDSWVHEQDMRRAVGSPGQLSGPVVATVVAWHRRNLGYVVAKRGKAPDGTTVVFDVEGDDGDRIAISVAGGRASEVDAATATPTTTLHLDVETFNALLSGRWDGAEAVASGRVRIEGEASLGNQVASAMAYVF
jgi:uncharacterized protein (TIGR03083 family)